MIEAILLNPGPGAVPKLSKRELEALAGWPNKGTKKRRNKGMAKKRKVSAYNRFVGKTMKAGKTMKQAARLWKGKGKKKTTKKKKVRKNSWPNDRKGHRKAAKKGWATQKRKSAKRSAAAKKAARTRKRKYGTKRKTKRNIVTNRKMSKAFYRKIGRKGGRATAKKRGYRKNIITNHGYSRNIITNGPREILEGVKQVFTLETMYDGLQITGGMFGAVMVPNLLFSIEIVDRYTPDFLKKGVGSYVVNLLGAGVLSGVAGWLGRPDVGRKLLIGGVAGTLQRIFTEQISKFAKTAPEGSFVKRVAASAGLAGMGADVEDAVEMAVEEELRRQGLSDYLTVPETESPALVGMGDFLVPEETEDPSLVGMSDYLVPEETESPMMV